MAASTKKKLKELEKFVTSSKYVNGIDTVFSVLEKDVLFNGLNFNDYAYMSLDEKRRLATKRIKRLGEYDFPKELLQDAVNRVHVLISPDSQIKRGIHMDVCYNKFIEIYSFDYHSIIMMQHKARFY